MTVEMVVANLHNKPDLSVLKLEAIPYEAFTRMQILLRRRDFVPLSMLFSLLPQYQLNPRFVEAIRILAHGLQYNFGQLRQELLRLKVPKKSDIYEIADNRHIVAELEAIQAVMNTAEVVINPILLAGPQHQE